MLSALAKNHGRTQVEGRWKRPLVHYVAEVTKMDMRVENGKVLAFRTRVALSFKYET
jgi:hypothetical protein